MDTITGLIHMANQIATNLATMQKLDTAAATADHIKKFWDPRMIAKIKAADQSRLLPDAQRAVELLDGPVASQTGGTEFASVNGTDHCDAG